MITFSTFPVKDNVFLISALNIALAPQSPATQNVYAAVVLVVYEAFDLNNVRNARFE